MSHWIALNLLCKRNDSLISVLKTSHLSLSVQACWLGMFGLITQTIHTNICEYANNEISGHHLCAASYSPNRPQMPQHVKRIWIYKYIHNVHSGFAVADAEPLDGGYLLELSKSTRKCDRPVCLCVFCFDIMWRILLRTAKQTPHAVRLNAMHRARQVHS